MIKCIYLFVFLFLPVSLLSQKESKLYPKLAEKKIDEDSKKMKSLRAINRQDKAKIETLKKQKYSNQKRLRAAIAKQKQDELLIAEQKKKLEVERAKSRKSGKIKKVQIGYVFKTGVPDILPKDGVCILVDFATENLLGETGYILATFSRRDNKKLLLDNNNKYQIKGYVALYEEFTSPYKRTTTESFELFIPHQEFHIGYGKHYMKVHLELRDESGTTLDSGTYNFSFFHDIL